ncbi:hypothetical protein ACL02R_11670 [Streptomyces sp. MS19]|uniref:hypothetical protein n=1 Tax=Streptomyces sp. MS19 TaxID=3385972 RepID=UPI0039A002BB
MSEQLLRQHRTYLCQTAVARPLGDAIDLELPLEFTAFCVLHQPCYLRYSEARLGSTPAAKQAVAAALGDLAMSWSSALASLSPARAAWSLLTDRVDNAPVAPSADATAALYRILPAFQADLVVLHHQLRVPLTLVSRTVGRPHGDVAGLLSLAERNMPLSTS